MTVRGVHIYLIFSPFNNKEIYTTLGILHCINLASIQEKTWINNIIHISTLLYLFHLIANLYEISHLKHRKKNQ